MAFFILKLQRESGKYLTLLWPLFLTGPVWRSEDNTRVSQVPELFTLPLPAHSSIKATQVSAQECQSLLQVGFGRKFNLLYGTSTVHMILTWAFVSLLGTGIVLLWLHHLSCAALVFFQLWKLDSAAQLIWGFAFFNMARSHVRKTDQLYTTKLAGKLKTIKF